MPPCTSRDPLRVGASLIDHLRDYVLDLGKYKAMQNFPMQEDRNKEDCNFFGNSIPQIEIGVNF